VPNPYLPVDFPSVAYEPWTDLRWRDDIAALNLSFPYGPMPSLYAKKIRQGYYSSVSYVDSLIGDVLGGLKEYRLDSDTVVVFTGDHGMYLMYCTSILLLVISYSIQFTKNRMLLYLYLYK